MNHPERKHVDPPADRSPALPPDLIPSLDSCCDEACCYVEWLRARGEHRR